MKKNLSRTVFFLLLLSTSFALTGCFEDEVTFKGRALIADNAYVVLGTEVKEIVLIRGPIAGAKVREAGHSEYALTDANGNYTLKIEVPRVIGLEKAKSYRLHCWAVDGTIGFVDKDDGVTVIHTGVGDEPLTSYAAAKAGDTIEVRDFVLHTHTGEKYYDEDGNQLPWPETGK